MDAATLVTADLTADLIGQVQSASLETKPFDHAYMEEVFPPARK